MDNLCFLLTLSLHSHRAFVSSFVTPLISAIWGGASFESLYFTVHGSQVKREKESREKKPDGRAGHASSRLFFLRSRRKGGVPRRARALRARRHAPLGPPLLLPAPR